MNIKITKLHQNNIWHSDRYWETYLPTEDGRFLRRKHEGRRIYDKDKYSFIFRVNYFYKYGTVLSKQEASNIIFGFNISTKEDYENHIKNTPSCVYEYIDKNDGVVKYVGIVYKQTLLQRHNQHLYNDKWCNESDFYIRYVTLKNRSEAEALEAHLIALHKTYDYYNTAKNDWGINSMLENYNPEWMEFSPEKCRKFMKIKKKNKNNIEPTSSGKRHMRRITLIES